MIITKITVYFIYNIYYINFSVVSIPLYFFCVSYITALEPLFWRV